MSESHSSARRYEPYDTGQATKQRADQHSEKPTEHHDRVELLAVLVVLESHDVGAPRRAVVGARLRWHRVALGEREQVQSVLSGRRVLLVYELGRRVGVLRRVEDDECGVVET